jgi:hypothetical protein
MGAKRRARKLRFGPYAMTMNMNLAPVRCWLDLLRRRRPVPLLGPLQLQQVPTVRPASLGQRAIKDKSSGSPLLACPWEVETQGAKAQIKVVFQRITVGF